MSWMADTAERRLDPSLSVPNAKSVVSVSVSYFHPEANTEGPLRIARYAQGRDYHRWMKRRVRKLRKTLLALVPGCTVYPTVDTSPVLERAWAAKAGTAWIGKSTMAIHPKLGTYTFLGTLITDTILEYDEPLPDRCGSCSACLDACPTQAFVEPYVLDATKCIAYWTLESPEGLPSEADLEGWIAGCDICQEVCPWNKFARPSTDPNCVPKAGLAQPDVDLFGDQNQEGEVDVLLQGTALKRTGAAAIIRNARHNLSRQQGSGPGET